jgi:hypothetical protein
MVSMVTNDVSCADDEGAVALRLALSSSRRNKRNRKRKLLVDHHHEGGSSLSSLSSEAYEGEDSESSSSFVLPDLVDTFGKSSEQRRGDDDHELELSHLQASFAERTAFEMEQLMEWWMKRTEIITTLSCDEETTTTTAKTLTTSFQEDDDLDMLQRQSLPHNSLVLVYEMDQQDCGEVSEHDDHSNVNTAPFLRPSRGGISHDDLVTPELSPAIQHSPLVGLVAALGLWTWEPAHPVSKSGNDENLKHVCHDDNEDLLQVINWTSINKLGFEQEIKPYDNAVSTLPMFPEQDWQGVAKLQTSQVNALCHDTQHMVDLLVELTEATATTSGDDDGDDDEHDFDYPKRYDNNRTNDDEGNVIANPRPRKRPSQFFKPSRRCCTFDIMNEDNDVGHENLIIELHWNELMELWCYQVSCRIQMCLLRLALQYIIPLQVLSLWIWWHGQCERQGRLVKGSHLAVTWLCRLVWNMVKLIVWYHLWQIMWCMTLEQTFARGVVSSKGGDAGMVKGTILHDAIIWNNPISKSHLDDCTRVGAKGAFFMDPPEESDTTWSGEATILSDVSLWGNSFSL